MPSCCVPGERSDASPSEKSAEDGKKCSLLARFRRTPHSIVLLDSRRGRWKERERGEREGGEKREKTETKKINEQCLRKESQRLTGVVKAVGFIICHGG